jgi:hypothetical protein
MERLGGPYLPDYQQGIEGKSGWNRSKLSEIFDNTESKAGHDAISSQGVNTL